MNHKSSFKEKCRRKRRKTKALERSHALSDGKCVQSVPLASREEDSPAHSHFQDFCTLREVRPFPDFLRRLSETRNGQFDSRGSINHYLIVRPEVKAKSYGIHTFVENLVRQKFPT
ncbi:hypothetical protein Naga_100104g22 [Nannochloropsis gaditana]|uniref:Uncharacterized protein n=1 Tax=Nannochloropsis gaditana TaxID=72520 RepID=W7TVY2_9STRA|nr:hypothetical protein Naga_100104g22 [Nannochloropsis gaditana]